MTSSLWEIVAAAFLGAIVAHVVDDIAKAAWHRWRRRTAYELWRDGADRAIREHSMPMLGPLPSKAVDLDMLSHEEQQRFFERMGAPRRGE